MVDSLVTERQRADHFFTAAQRWLSRNGAGSVVLVCHGDPLVPLGSKQRPAVGVPGCLRDLPLYRLVDLFLAGIRDVAAVQGQCCVDSGVDVDVTGGWRSRLGDLLQWSSIETKRARTWSWSISPTRVPVDRRGLLGLGRTDDTPWPIHGVEDDVEARLVTSLRAAGISTIEEPPPGLALLAQGCTACGVCVAACPHDALELAVDGPMTTLLHSPGACQGEQQCVALCPVDALNIKGPLAWAVVLDGSPQILATLETAVCERCKARFPAGSGQSWCETCRIRRSDPFGSHLPDAAIKLLQARGFDRPA